MKYKITNKLGVMVNLGKIVFEAGETKELDEKPYSDKFIVEEIKSNELIIEKIEQKPTKLKENKK